MRAITPVPGGIGPMTVASLFENLLLAYESQNHKKLSGNRLKITKISAASHGETDYAHFISDIEREKYESPPARTRGQVIFHISEPRSQQKLIICGSAARPDNSSGRTPRNLYRLYPYNMTAVTL